MPSPSEINPTSKAGMASQLASYDPRANMRANPQVFNGSDKGGTLGVSATGRPGDLQQKGDGTASPRVTTQTYAAAMPSTPTGSVGPNLSPSNYGNGVQKFSGQGVVASGPKAPQGVPAVYSTT
jgi:hypothetical protein